MGYEAVVFFVCDGSVILTIFNPFGVGLVLLFSVPPVSPVVINIKAFQAFFSLLIIAFSIAHQF